MNKEVSQMNITLFTLYLGKAPVSSMNDLRAIKILAEVYALTKNEPVKLVNNLGDKTPKEIRQKKE